MKKFLIYTLSFLSLILITLGLTTYPPMESLANSKKPYYIKNDIKDTFNIKLKEDSIKFLVKSLNTGDSLLKINQNKLKKLYEKK